MARKCKGDWDSWIGKPYKPSEDRNDGRITIGKPNASGKFSGTHSKSPQEEHPFDGQCDESPHHIHLVSEEEGYIYDGEIVVKDGKDWVTNGTRSRILKDRSKPLDDEEWVAVKTT